jgi:hypothetical protein
MTTVILTGEASKGEKKNTFNMNLRLALSIAPIASTKLDSQ